jgi:hypothetical protein
VPGVAAQANRETSKLRVVMLSDGLVETVKGEANTAKSMPSVHPRLGCLIARVKFWTPSPGLQKFEGFYEKLDMKSLRGFVIIDEKLEN